MYTMRSARDTCTVGSPEHKNLFCRFFLDTHLTFEPAALPWPALDEPGLARLRSLPFWNEALSTERQTTCTVQARAAIEPDPQLREVLTLQAYEEERHAATIAQLIQHYDLPGSCRTTPRPPEDAQWAFLCTGYSECFDAFFSFALFALARDTGFFPAALVDIFEPIMQEEARHIVFFVNWEAYMQAQQHAWQRPAHWWRGAYGRALQVWQRLQMARGMQHGQDFTVTGHRALHTAMTPRAFLALCLQENDRRLGGYDARLLRPRLVPTIARALYRVLP
jgi:hypothetical protein